MSDAIRQAAEECAREINDDAHYSENLTCPSVDTMTVRIERAMRKLLDAQRPSPAAPEASGSVRLDGETHCVLEPSGFPPCRERLELRRDGIYECVEESSTGLHWVLVLPMEQVEKAIAEAKEPVHPMSEPCESTEKCWAKHAGYCHRVFTEEQVRKMWWSCPDFASLTEMLNVDIRDYVHQQSAPDATERMECGHLRAEWIGEEHLCYEDHECQQGAGCYPAHCLACERETALLELAIEMGADWAARVVITHKPTPDDVRKSYKEGR